MNVNMPQLKKWSIYTFFDYSRIYDSLMRNAIRLRSFMNDAKVGDRIIFLSQDADDSENSFSLKGRVYNRANFSDGDLVVTSKLYYVERVEDDELGAAFVAQTKNTRYYIHDEGVALWRGEV